jgi:hypothetical protein
MLYGSMDPNERFRSRRATNRRRRRRRRAAVLGAALLVVFAVAGGATLVSKNQAAPATPHAAAGAAATRASKISAPQLRALPVEVRGVHVTGPLASLPGKLRAYMELERFGLNTIQLDVKDESGELGFVPSAVRLAIRAGAARDYYRPRAVAREAHARGLYLIGRVVTFQDPILSAARPDLAIRRPDGSVWKTSAGLGWLNPYDKRTWDYAVSVAEVAARAGFDEIMFDYIRFPSDGDIASAVYPGRTSMPKGRQIADFVAYAKRRLEPLGVRVSTAVFGLSATRDLGIGQIPRFISQHADSVYAMSYPALYGNGELGIENPEKAPGETVFRTLADFRRQLAGRRSHLLTWVQDFSGYGLEDVRAQIEAARLQGAKGFLLWNASGVYTERALAPPEGP